MKLSMALVPVAFLCFCCFAGIVHSSSTGPPPSASGVPAGGEFDGETVCAACHTSFPLNPDGEGKVELLGVPDRYAPGQRYTLTFKIRHPSATRWGFQATAVAVASFRGAGGFTPADANSARIDGGLADRVYVGHAGTGRRAATGIGEAGGYSWSFDWVAPSSNVGEVAFYGIGAAADSDGSQLGDKIYSPSPAPLARAQGDDGKQLALVPAHAPGRRAFGQLGPSLFRNQAEPVTKEATWLRTRDSAR